MPDRPRRLAYLGTPAVAVPPLQALVAAGFEVPVVVTGADKRRGRGSATTASPVKKAASELGLTVSHDVDDLLGAGAQLGVVVAFGRLIRPHVLAAVPMVNLHFSLLPRWRGAAPVERAVLAGDPTTGVCLMAVEHGLDTGGVYRRAEVPIGPGDTVDGLRLELVERGVELLLDAFRHGFGPAEPQRGEPTYAAKLTAAELELDWGAPAVVLDRVVRTGGAWTTLRGARCKVLAASPVAAPVGLGPGELAGTVVGTGAGALELHEVQPEGRRRQLAAEWVRGARLADGERFGR
jgi:methionyl-tRNA formyltransferase